MKISGLAAVIAFAVGGMVQFVGRPAWAQSTPYCEKNSECPAYLAQIVVVDQGANQPSVCSAFLIHPQYLVTNRHCLPPALRQAGGSCKGIRVEFPKTPDFQNEAVNCESVVQTSDQLPVPLKWATDFAVLKLQKAVGRGVLEFSNEIVRSGDSVQIFKVDPPPPGKSTPVLRKKNCDVASSLVNPNFTREPAPEMTLKDCGVIGGNSGSPVLNKKNQAIGIIWGGGRLQVSADIQSGAVMAGLMTPFHCFTLTATQTLLPKGNCALDLNPAELKQVEKDYHDRKSAKQEGGEQLKKQLEASFALLQSKMKESLNRLEGAEFRAAFGWAAQELRLRDEEARIYWGKQLAVPLCVHRKYLRDLLERKKMPLERTKLAIQVPIFNLIRVTGDPGLFYTTLVDGKPATISGSFNSAHEDVKKVELSYQVEVAPDRTELRTVELADCGQLQKH